MLNADQWSENIELHEGRQFYWHDDNMTIAFI